MESNTRSIAKAVSYRTLGSISTGLLVYLFSGSLRASVSVGALDTVVKLALYYLHERAWNHIDYGRPKPPEYEI
jgi:uncharacterized membrane protein